MITTADFLDFDYFPVKDETAERSPTLTLKCQHVLPACFATSLNFSVLKNSSEICTGVIKSTVIALIFFNQPTYYCSHEFDKMSNCYNSNCEDVYCFHSKTNIVISYHFIKSIVQ